MKKFNNIGFTTRGPLVAGKLNSDWQVLNETFACWGMASGAGCSTSLGGITLRADETKWSCDLLNKMYNKQIGMGAFGAKNHSPIPQCVQSKDSEGQKWQAVKTTAPMRMFYGNQQPSTTVQTLESFLHEVQKDDVASVMAQLLWTVKVLSSDPDGQVHNDMEPANILVNGLHGTALRTTLLNPFYMETCELHKSSMVVPAHKAQAPPERFMADLTRKNGTLSRANGQCSATDLWSVGVTFLQVLTRGTFLAAINSDLTKHQVDNSDLQAQRVTQWLIDFGKAQNKMGKLKTLQKSYASILDGRQPQWDAKMKADMDFIKKLGLESDSALKDLFSGLLNEDPDARITVDAALDNMFIKKAITHIKQN